MNKSAKELSLYRKRLIPSECILLKDDIVVEQTDDIIITKWQTLNPKATMDHGCSCYFLKEGFKVSKFYRADNSLLCWYCDIMDYEYQSESNTFISTDLLADVVLYPDGRIRVVDLDELAQASEEGLITAAMLHLALRRLDSLLRIIYNNEFDRIQAVFKNANL